MEENYYKKIKYELENIKGQREILEERMKRFNFYKKPGIFAREFLFKGSFSRINSIKNKIYERDTELLNQFSLIEQEYSKRFDNLKLPELLIKYEKIHGRVRDLEKRYYKLDKRRTGLFGSSRKRLDAVLKKVETEKIKREDIRDEIVHEFESGRGISLEQIYMDN